MSAKRSSQRGEPPPPGVPKLVRVFGERGTVQCSGCGSQKKKDGAVKLSDTPCPRCAIRTEYRAAALHVRCVQCRADVGQRCKNYKGEGCAPHRERVFDAKMVDLAAAEKAGELPTITRTKAAELVSNALRKHKAVAVVEVFAPAGDMGSIHIRVDENKPKPPGEWWAPQRHKPPCFISIRLEGGVGEDAAEVKPPHEAIARRALHTALRGRRVLGADEGQSPDAAAAPATSSASSAVPDVLARLRTRHEARSALRARLRTLASPRPVIPVDQVPESVPPDSAPDTRSRRSLDLADDADLHYDEREQFFD